MKIRWILGCFCAVVSVLTSASDKAKQEVVMYTESQYRPYSYIEDGQLKGIYIDLIARMNQELPEYKITTYAMPWFEALNNVKKAKGDAILGTYFLGKSRPQIYPYSMPIYKEEIILVCSDKTIPKGDYNFPQDFQGKVIANVKGYEAWRRDAVKNISYESYFRFF
ncbi:substrate-binding periplasmic protein [Glaciecola sp. 1036]|uniref:substrate-binding periplasmic protein n=1 Tax=Alteromonadaceae TaxID=72275 RepID=UPI003D01C09C